MSTAVGGRSQLQDVKAIIGNGNILGFYNDMSSQGCGYGNLGKDVVKSILLTGVNWNLTPISFSFVIAYA